MNSKILIAGLAALSLSACTSINPYTGQSQVSNTTGGALVGAGGGAVVGAIIGGATGDDPRVGALIGAGLGGLTGAPWSASTWTSRKPNCAPSCRAPASR